MGVDRITSCTANCQSRKFRYRKRRAAPRLGLSLSLHRCVHVRDPLPPSKPRVLLSRTCERLVRVRAAREWVFHVKQPGRYRAEQRSRACLHHVPFHGSLVSLPYRSTPFFTRVEKRIGKFFHLMKMNVVGYICWWNERSRRKYNENAVRINYRSVVDTSRRDKKERKRRSRENVKIKLFKLNFITRRKIFRLTAKKRSNLEKAICTHTYPYIFLNFRQNRGKTVFHIL